MPGRNRKAWLGIPVKNPPAGFPFYGATRRPRVVTADVWSYLRYLVATRLPKDQESEPIAFLEQALEFFEAADNPLLGSRPLLYYYSFLNLAKMAILVAGINLPPQPKHGISDPKANVRKRLRFEGQVVRTEKRAHDYSQVFPEFVHALGGRISKPREFKLLLLLSQIPGIHRTFCSVTGESNSFAPTKKFDLLRADREIWVRLALAKDDQDVKTTLPIIRKRQAFRRVFDPVQAETNGELWFETDVVQGAKRGTDTAIKSLAGIVKGIGLWPILTSSGNRFYMSTLPPRDRLPPLASIYAVMFYLGSLTRYKPYDFDKIINRKYAWLIGEFLRTQPTQFLYGLASHLGSTEVVRPFAAVT